MTTKEGGLRGSIRNVGVGAIPGSEADQKLIHRWVLNDVNGTVEDSIGTANGSNNGVSSVAGDWAGGSAGDADGVDDNIITTTLGDFGSNMDTNLAVAFSFQTTDGDDDHFMGVNNDAAGGDKTIFQIAMGHLSGVSEGQIPFYFRDSNTDTISTVTDGVYNDGSEYRAVFNKTGNTASDLEIWINQTEVSTSVRDDGSFSSPSNFATDLRLFDINFDNKIDAIMDDVCIFGDSLTQSEIESYQNPWQ